MKKYVLDTLESKLFGIGSEAYTVGSHEFYLGYALKKIRRVFVLTQDISIQQNQLRIKFQHYHYS